MKFSLSHTERALIITLIIEFVIIVALFSFGFKEKPKEQTYSVNFVDDDFDFNELKDDEKIELPDIQKYVNQKYNTNVASNALQEEAYFDKFKQHQEEELKEFYKKRTENKQQTDIGEIPPQKKEAKKNKSFTGNSNIRYFIKNRQGIYIANPLYTCPEDMHGLIIIDIEVDQSGKIVNVKYNKKKSSTTADCLIENSLEAAKESFFNSDSSAPPLQKGYISYNY